MANSLSKRLTYRIMAVVLVMMAIIAGLVYYTVRKYMINEAKERYLNILLENQQELRRRLSDVYVAARNNVHDIERDIDDPDKMFDHLERLVKINPSIVCSSLMFERNYYPSKGRVFIPCARRDEEGNVRKSEIDSTYHSLFYDEWFDEQLKKDETNWSKAYFENKLFAGDQEQRLLTTFTIPIHDHQGRPVAILCSDMSLEDLREHMMEDIKDVNDRHEAGQKHHSYFFVIDQEGNIMGYDILDYNLDNIRTGHFVTRMYQKWPEAKNLKAMQLMMKQLQDQPRTIADKVYWHKAIYAYQVWLDGIFMGLPFRVLTAPITEKVKGLKGKKVKKDPVTSIYDDAVNQLKITYERTLDPKTGLNRHAYDETRKTFWADKETGLSQHCWGRAQGWYTMALIEVLDALPEDYARRSEVIDLLVKDFDAILKWQDKKSGVWYQVMDEPGRDGNYLESTCSAMFTYALLKAARKGYVSEKYRDAGIKAYKGMIEKFIKVNADKTISLTQCCSVAGLGPAVTPEVEAAMKKVNPKGSVKENKKRDGSYEYYLSEPIRDNDAKGVGPFIWASLEMEMMGYTTEEK